MVGELGSTEFKVCWFSLKPTRTQGCSECTVTLTPTPPRSLLPSHPQDKILKQIMLWRREAVFGSDVTDQLQALQPVIHRARTSSASMSVSCDDPSMTQVMLTQVCVCVRTCARGLT